MPGWDARQRAPTQDAAEGTMPLQRIIQNETEADCDVVESLTSWKRSGRGASSYPVLLCPEMRWKDYLLHKEAPALGWCWLDHVAEQALTYSTRNEGNAVYTHALPLISFSNRQTTVHDVKKAKLDCKLCYSRCNVALQRPPRGWGFVCVGKGSGVIHCRLMEQPLQAPSLRDSC